MSDTALISWLAGGAPVALPAEELAARRASEFVARFMEALYPADDLGVTQELHEAAVANNVYAVHRELNALGEEAYSDTWRLISAGNRAAIKRYVAMVKP